MPAVTGRLRADTKHRQSLPVNKVRVVTRSKKLAAAGDSDPVVQIARPMSALANGQHNGSRSTPAEEYREDSCARQVAARITAGCLLTPTTINGVAIQAALALATIGWDNVTITEGGKQVLNTTPDDLQRASLDVLGALLNILKAAVAMGAAVPDFSDYYILPGLVDDLKAIEKANGGCS